MKRSRLLIEIAAIALVALVVGGGVYLYMSRQSTASADHAPMPMTSMNENPPLVGTIDRIEEREVMVKTSDNSIITLKLADQIPIQQQVVVPLSEVQAGAPVTVLGIEKGGVFHVDVILLGGDEALMSGLVPIGNDVAVAGEAPESAPPGGAIVAPPPLIGTVERIEGQTMLVKDTTGRSISVQIDRAKAMKPVDIKLADIQVGQTVMAAGELKGKIFETNKLRVVISS